MTRNRMVGGVRPVQSVYAPSPTSNLLLTVSKWCFCSCTLMLVLVSVWCQILKSYVSTVRGTSSNLINTTYKLGKFPAWHKQAQILPLYKKKDPLNKENFRPVSLLPIISKIYERSMHDQLSEHLNSSFNPFLAVLVNGSGCQSTLLRLLEDWHKALDNQKCVAAVLMDLSKAFDCLPLWAFDCKVKGLWTFGGGSQTLGQLSQ